MEMSTDSIVQARVDSDTKRRASRALQAMGLSVSDAIRLFLQRVADEKRLPFADSAPNATTVEAMQELEKGRGTRFSSAEKLFEDIGV